MKTDILTRTQGPPFSVRELHFLPLSQAQPARKPLFQLNMFVNALFTSDVSFKRVLTTPSCIIYAVLWYMYLHKSCTLQLEITIFPLIPWFSVNCKALQRRRAFQRLAIRQHLRYLGTKRFVQKFWFCIAFVAAVVKFGNDVLPNFSVFNRQ